MAIHNKGKVRVRGCKLELVVAITGKHSYRERNLAIWANNFNAILDKTSKYTRNLARMPVLPYLTALSPVMSNESAQTKSISNYDNKLGPLCNCFSQLMIMIDVHFAKSIAR